MNDVIEYFTFFIASAVLGKTADGVVAVSADRELFRIDKGWAILVRHGAIFSIVNRHGRIDVIRAADDQCDGAVVYTRRQIRGFARIVIVGLRA